MNQTYDHNAEPAYYPRPEGISDADWNDYWLKAAATGYFMGPRRDGLWTIEKLDKAIAWQQRRLSGVPYIRRLGCASCRVAGFYCWVVHSARYIDHVESFELAVIKAEQVLKDYTPAQRFLIKIAATKQLVSSLGVDL